MVSRLVGTATARHFARHPWQFFLTVIGVALGVAVVVSVDVANDAAARAFAVSSETVTGRATHQIIGGPGGLDERLYVRLRTQLGVRMAAPVIEGYARLDGETLHLLGVDPLAEAGLRSHLAGLKPATTSRLLTEPATVALADVTATRLGLVSGSRIALHLGPRTPQVSLVAVIPTNEQNRARLDGLLFADIATAQELLGMAERLSWIDLALPDGPGGARVLARIRAALPATVEIVPAAARSEALAQMTRAFRINLTAMSLLALLVGMFLIYNTMTFAVLQRRRLLGLLRALGVTRRELFALVLREGLLVGALGTAFGLLAGIALGHGLIQLVARTINDHYFVVSVATLTVAASPLVKGAALGILASLAAVIVPAREAAVTPPRLTLTRSVLEAQARAATPRLAAAGVLLLAVALIVLWTSPRGLVTAFVALFFALIGMTLTAPLLVRLATRGSSAIIGMRLGPTARLALRGIDASLSRTGVAIAALMLAIATTIGVGVMIASFRASVANWLDTTLRADLYVATPSLRSTRNPAHLDPDFVSRVPALSGIRHVSSARTVVIESRTGLNDVMALDIPRWFARRFTLLQGKPTEALDAFFEGRGVLVTEPYAYRRRVGVGDSIELRTDRGRVQLAVAGVFRDYATEQGQVVMIRSLYDRLFDDPHVSTLGIWLDDNADPQAVIRALRAQVPSGTEVLIRSNREIRELSLAIFDRTFTITSVLRLLAVVAAVIGILSAFMALSLERAHELAVLRAVGFTPGQIRALVLNQTGAMGLLAGLLAMPVGAVLAWLLIHVINRRAFGWSMDALLPAPVFAEGLVLALAAALLAGVYPAIRMSRARPAESLREE
jgi:putative ABC transport system permease protein